MLSLNSLGPTPQENRINAEARPKLRLPEEQKTQGDFSAYMAALAQPVKLDVVPQNQARPNEAPVAEKPVAVQKAAEATAAAEATTTTTQKAGAEPATSEPVNSRTEREAAETKSVKAQPIRSEKELLEALGLVAKKAPVSAAEALQKTAQPAIAAQTSTALEAKAGAAKADKNQTAATTLQQLQKTPDLILANAEGLKRLGEKLGLAFLGKVSEKLGEKPAKTESTQNTTRNELKGEAVVQTTTAKLQKAGSEPANDNTAFQNQNKSAKTTPAKSVSRETIAAEITEKPAPLGGSDLKPVSIPDTATGRLSGMPAAGEVRLGESVATIRNTEIIRGAVENPMLRADLVRQLSEVMGRAQVMVSDSQNAQFTVKLFPRDLGRMEIDLKMVDGEIRGKIVVENEDVKNEMQNFLDQRENSSAEQQIDLNRIDIEVRSGSQNAQNPERTPDADALLQNLVTRAATSAYEATETPNGAGTALYA